MMNVTDRFLRYVQVETTSSENSDTCPSTPGQRKLAEMLRDELQAIGLASARMDENGYVYAFVPGKGPRADVAVGLIAHMDTSGAVPGATTPHIIRNYDGEPIVLENGVVIDGFDFLPSLAGQDLVVGSGDSVLGADDKAGVAEIVTLAERLMAPDAPDHCTVCIGFTPDEEIGRGTDRFDLAGFGADYGYTVDGGRLGELEFECFNAATATVTVAGVSIHPGNAKNRMKNACLMALEFAAMMPPAETPAHTEGYEGFYHLCGMTGTEEQTVLTYILRDHDADKLEQKKAFMQRAAEYLNAKYGEGTVTVSVRDSYRNMKEIIEWHPHIVEKARQAFEACGVTPIIKPIRGGTDGARLSYEGLPCPNLSTGGFNYHGRMELIPIQSMEKMVDVLQAIVCNA